MKEFTFEEVKDMIDNLEPKINEMTIEEFNTMVINDVKIMNHIQKFIPLLDFNCALTLFRSDVTVSFNINMVYGKDGILLNKVPLDPDDINYLKKEFEGEYYSKTRVASFRVSNIPKIAKYYVISIDGTMYDVIDNDIANTINLDTFTKNRIISVYMLYHNILHNWIQSNICNLDVSKEKERKYSDKDVKFNKLIDDVLKSIDKGDFDKITAELINASSKSCLDTFLDRISSDNFINETKNFIFGVEHKMYGTKTVRVPKDFTLEQAKQYVQEHWSKISLPLNSAYIAGSDEPNFDGCNFS